MRSNFFQPESLELQIDYMNLIISIASPSLASAITDFNNNKLRLFL